MNRRLDSSGAVRAVSISRTKGCTTAAAEVLGTSIVVGFNSLGNDSSSVVDSALIVEVPAVASAEDDVEDAIDHPEDAEEETQIADQTEDEQADDEVDDATAKRRDHTSKWSEDGGGLELDEDEEDGEEHEVGGEHTDGQVGSVPVEADASLDIVVDTLGDVVGIGVGGDEREDTVDEEHGGAEEGEDVQEDLELASSRALAAADAFLFNEHVWGCTWHCCSASHTEAVSVTDTLKIN